MTNEEHAREMFRWLMEGCAKGEGEIAYAILGRHLIEAADELKIRSLRKKAAEKQY